jgi:hypothetical protein
LDQAVVNPRFSGLLKFMNMGKKGHHPNQPVPQTSYSYEEKEKYDDDCLKSGSGYRLMSEDAKRRIRSLKDESDSIVLNEWETIISRPDIHALDMDIRHIIKTLKPIKVSKSMLHFRYDVDGLSDSFRVETTSLSGRIRVVFGSDYSPNAQPTPSSLCDDIMEVLHIHSGYAHKLEASSWRLQKWHMDRIRESTNLEKNIESMMPKIEKLILQWRQKRIRMSLSRWINRGYADKDQLHKLVDEAIVQSVIRS